METAENKNNRVMDMIGYVYDLLLEGKLPGYRSVRDLAEDFMFPGWSCSEQIDALVVEQSQKAAMIGFTTTLVGGPIIIATLPFNVASVICLQVQMIAAIAHIRGYDLENEKVRLFVIGCLLGQKFSDILAASGVQIGNSVTAGIITKLPVEYVTKINTKVGIKLAKKVSTKGVIKYWKVIPFINGIICGGFDWHATNQAGKKAKKIFMETEDITV